MTDIEDCIKVILTMVISLTTVLAIVFGIVNIINKSQCEGYHKVTGKLIKYQAFTCYAYDSDSKQWIVLDIKTSVN